MSARSRLRNKHLGTWDLLICSCSSGSELSFDVSSAAGVCAVFSFPKQKHIHISWVMLVYHTSFSPVPLLNALMLSVEPWLMIFVLMGDIPANLFLKSSPCAVPEMLLPLWVEPKFKTLRLCVLHCLRWLCPWHSQLQEASLVPYMLFFSNPLCPTPCSCDPPLAIAPNL